MGNSHDRGYESEEDAALAKARREPPKISEAYRSLIKDVWNNAKHNEIGSRIFTRIFFRRPDFKLVFDSISKDAWVDEARRLTNVLDNLIRRIDDLPALEESSRKLGQEYVRFKEYGFRPEYLVAFSEATTAECMYLDTSSSHSISENTQAWSTFVTVVVSNIREGYYDRLRTMRRLSKQLSKMSSVDSSSSYESSNSAADDSCGGGGNGGTSNNPSPVRPKGLPMDLPNGDPAAAALTPRRKRNSLPMVAALNSSNGGANRDNTRSPRSGLHAEPSPEGLMGSGKGRGSNGFSAVGKQMRRRLSAATALATVE